MRPFQLYPQDPVGGREGGREGRREERKGGGEVAKEVAKEEGGRREGAKEEGGTKRRKSQLYTLLLSACPFLSLLPPLPPTFLKAVCMYFTSWAMKHDTW